MPPPPSSSPASPPDEAKAGGGQPGVVVPATEEGVRARWDKGPAEERLEYRRALLDALARSFTVLPVGKGGGGGVMTVERVAERVKPDWRF